jgi:diguanylate cyclase (GGDEF)-like protein
MTIDELLALLGAETKKKLNSVQELVLRQAWEGQSYTQIAATSSQEVDYLKTSASRLWHVISLLLGKPINKTNFRQVLESTPMTSEQQNLIEEFSRCQTLVQETDTTESGNNCQLPIANCQSLEYPSGPVPLDSIFYIPRPPIEELAYQEITKPGSAIRIKAPKEMGKSSLMSRILAHAATLGYRTVNLDLQQVDKAILSNLDKFLRYFCSRVSWKLNLKPNLKDYWDEDIGSKVSCTVYFRWYLLEHLEVPVVLALNETSRLFENSSLAQEFLTLLRSWYEEAQQDETWQKLRLVVMYSTDIEVPLSINQSPFNVGLPLKLPEFTREQVEDLARRHDLNWTDGSQVKQLMAMVGGHPALVRLALYHLVSPSLEKEIGPPQPPQDKNVTSTDLKQLLQNADTEVGIYRDHLRRLWATLQSKPELAAAFKTLVIANRHTRLEPIVVYELESMGLVKLVNDEVTVSYELYRRYFRQKFLQGENLRDTLDRTLGNGATGALPFPLENGNTSGEEEEVVLLETPNPPLQRLRTIDELTKLPNRYYFDQYLEQQWYLTCEVAPLCLILCDLDFFKKYNDKFGHKRGDAYLQQVAHVIRECVNCPSNVASSIPLVARYGGDEFAVILPQTEVSDAVQIAQEINQQVKALAKTFPSPSVRQELNNVLSISIGVACTIPMPESSPMVLLVAADEALYQSKAKGRDRVNLYGDRNH